MTAFRVALAGALALAGGCTGCPQDKGALQRDPAMPPRPAEEDEPVGTSPLIGLRVPPSVAYGETAEISVIVENRTDVPIVVLEIRAPSGSLDAPASLRAAAAEEGDLRIEGTLEVEDLGPIARAPRPPRWTWTGDVPVRSAPALAPGESIERSFRVRATDALKGRLDAALQYARLEPDVAAYRIERATIEPPPGAPPPGPAAPPGRWVPAARASARLARVRAVGPGGGRRIEWRRTGDVFLDPAAPEPVLYAYAFAAAALDGLPAEGASISLPLAIERPAFDLPEARAKAGVPAEAKAVYLPAANAWVIVAAAGGSSLVVSAERKVQVAGDAGALAEALVEHGSAEVRLEAPFEKASVFTEREIEVSASERKGGGRDVRLRVPAEKLLLFAEGAAAAGLRLDGLRLAPAD